jgi:aryl-alcohol dehydrogenase-like predicted oxidoreductase
MDYRALGKSGLKVSPLCLGTMMFGDRTDEAEAAGILRSARDAGVNFVDTADQYAKGESERMLGRLLAADRDWWVVATKVGNPMGSSPNDVGLSASWIHRAIDASLSRLRMDHVDIYYLHRDFSDAPLEEAVRAMGDVLRAGKARYFGISNFRGWRIAEIIRLCHEQGVPQPIVCQPYYNALNRMPEVEILPACDHYGIGVVPYSPIARGVLTGKYQPGAVPPADTRAGRSDKRMMETEFREESLVLARQWQTHAESKGFTVGQFAFAWVLANRIVTSVIGGPRTLAQWEEYYRALAYPWGAEDDAIVDAAVRPGHPSTPGFNDPQYPFFGRRVQS